jgi:signal transduction histidine kinase
MIRRLLGPVSGPIVFLLVAALVFAGLGWVTVTALRVEDAQRQGAVEAQQANNLRLALWRMDGRLLQPLGIEDSRPYHHYAGGDAPAAYGPASGPLLDADFPAWMLLHFQVDPLTGWSSPQVMPEADVERLRAQWAGLTLRNVTPERAALLADLSNRHPAAQVSEVFAARERAIPPGSPPLAGWQFATTPTPAIPDQLQPYPPPGEAPPIPPAEPGANLPPVVPDPNTGPTALGANVNPEYKDPYARFANGARQAEQKKDANAPPPRPTGPGNDFALGRSPNRSLENSPTGESQSRNRIIGDGGSDARSAGSYPVAQSTQMNPMGGNPAAGAGLSYGYGAYPPAQKPAGGIGGGPGGGPVSGGFGGGPNPPAGPLMQRGAALGGPQPTPYSTPGTPPGPGAAPGPVNPQVVPTAAGPVPAAMPQPGPVGGPGGPTPSDRSMKSQPNLRGGGPGGGGGGGLGGVGPLKDDSQTATNGATSGPKGAAPTAGFRTTDGNMTTEKRASGGLFKELGSTLRSRDPELRRRETDQLARDNRGDPRTAPAPDPTPEPPLPVVPPAAFIPPAQPVTVYLGAMRPQWLTDPDGTERLVLVRAVRIDNQRTVYQGVVLDWPRLEAVLKDAVGELFPDARLVPVKDPRGVSPERAMTALPVQLDPGPVPAAGPAGWTPLRLGLLLAWVAAVIAFAAVGLSGWSLIDLAERRIRFVSAVTHELRSPLTSLRLYLDLLLSGMVEDEQKRREYLATLNTESDRLHRLIDNVLDFARLEGRRKAADAQPVRVIDLLDQVRQTWADRCAADDKELVAISTLPPDEKVCTDLDLVQQIVGNLIDNARKYTREAGDRRIWLWAKPGGRRRVVFEVEDRGPGVPPRERKLIFRPFRRGESADTKAGGAGLGLALAKQWAELLGGRLSYRPADGGVGACFRFELRLK